MKIIVLLLLTLAFSGCVTNKAFHLDYKESCTWEVVEKSGICFDSHIQGRVDEKINLSIVEYDEQGLARSNQAIDRIIERVRSRDNQIVYLFVHGWHHNSKNVDDNLIGFKNFLKVSSTQHPDKKITGIYVGWRGESLNIPYLNIATFWGRKNTSIDVGDSSIIDFLTRLELVAQNNKNTEKTKLIAIGHSFGASVLLSAIDSLLVERINKSGSESVQGYGDITILLNPAIEAKRFYPIYTAINRRISESGNEAYANQEKPIFAIITTEKDYATRLLFPIGRFFSTVFERHIPTLDKHSEFKMDIFTVGHYKPFFTHSMTAYNNISDYEKANGAWSCKKPSTSFKLNSATWPYTFPSSFIKIDVLDGINKRMPFMIAHVDGDIMTDHNNIKNRHMMCFLSELLY